MYLFSTILLKIPFLQLNLQIDFNWKIALSAGLLTIISIIAFFIWKNSLKTTHLIKSHKRIVKVFLFLINGILIVLAVSLTVWGLKVIKRKTESDIRNTVQTILTTTQQTLHIWIHDQKTYLHQIANDKKLVELVTQLIEADNRNEELINHSIQLEIRDFFKQREGQFGNVGYFIINTEGKSLASMRDSNIGSENLIYLQKPMLFDLALQGNSQMIPPIVSDVPIAGSKNIAGLSTPPTMFFIEPIVDSTGSTIAILSKRYDPKETFSQILNLGRMGETGETYAFNKDGYLISGSRFISQLENAQLISDSDSEILSIEIRDPGDANNISEAPNYKNINNPLTLMAKDCIAGNTGSNISGYRDYRGITVVGAWMWIEDLSIGMTTEIDYKEAFSSYTSAEIVILTILFLIMFLTIFFTTIFYILSDRTNKALHISNLKLDEKVNERTKELILAKNTAENANKIKSLFLANMSHEIRTPMNAILGYSQILQQDTTLSERQKYNIDTIRNSGEHLLELINDVLTISKIEAGKIKINYVNFDIHRLIEEITESFKNSLLKKKLIMNIKIDSQFPDIIYADINHITQILTKLIGNAINFTEIGEITLTAKSNKNIINIEIEDTGIGISERNKEKVFGLFEQENPGNHSVSGTGLGLTISRKLARLMNGDITFKSKIGQGSKFNFSFEYEKGHIKHINSENSLSRTVVALAKRSLDTKVLIADDRYNNREVARQLLEPIGFKIEIAVNGSETIEKCKLWQPDILLLDLAMPDFDCETVVKKIREENSTIAIIALSASIIENEYEIIQKIGVDSYLRKPFELSKLLEKIKAVSNVEYIYQKKEEKKKLDTFDSDLSALKPEIKKRILNATIIGDINRLHSLVQQLIDDKIPQGKYLKKCVDEFEFEKIKKELETDNSFNAGDLDEH